MLEFHERRSCLSVTMETVWPSIREVVLRMGREQFKKYYKRRITEFTDPLDVGDKKRERKGKREGDREGTRFLSIPP